jgi:hypothetical protein
MSGRSVIRLVGLAVAAVGCASSGGLPLADLGIHPAVTEGDVRVYQHVDEADLRGPLVRVSTRATRAKHRSVSAQQRALATFKTAAAAHGANVVLVDEDVAEQTYWAYRLTHVDAFRGADSLEQARATAIARARSAASMAPASTGGGQVYVRGYCRKDGVCVQPHTRRKPSKSGRRGG